MKFRSVLFNKGANFKKFRMSAKVWRVQIKIPCGRLPKNIAPDKSAKLAVFQVLN